MDEQTAFFHGEAHTNFDALSHVFHDGKMYNGFPEPAAKPNRAQALDATNYSEGLFTRRVLVDIAWLRGVPYLDPSTVIYPADFDAWERKTVFISIPATLCSCAQAVGLTEPLKGPWDIGSHAAGLSALCARWLKQRDVAVLDSELVARCCARVCDGWNGRFHQSDRNVLTVSSRSELCQHGRR